MYDFMCVCVCVCVVKCAYACMFACTHGPRAGKAACNMC